MIKNGFALALTLMIGLALPPSMMAALAAPAKAKGVQPIAPGIYSDVRMSEQTGDLGGIEIKILGGKDSGWADVVYCQGWCNTVDRTKIVREMNGYRVDYRESYFEMDDKGNRSNETVMVTPMHLRPTAKGLMVTHGEGEDRRTRVLKRKKNEFGLDVARKDPAQP
jgi:hypothetical protein